MSGPRNPMRRRVGVAFAAAGVTALLVFGAALLTRGAPLGDAGAETARTLPVETITVRHQETYETDRVFAGRVLPARVTDLAFQVSGEVASVAVQIGDRVEGDAVLSTLDPERLGFAQDQASAARDEAQAALTRASATLTRIETLAAEGYATAQERDDAVAERDAARERVRRLDRSLAVAEVDAGDAALLAPYAGTVVSLSIEAGDTVRAGDPVMRINAAGALEAEIGLPAGDARGFAVGDTATLKAGDERFTARVTSVGDDVDEATRTVPVRLEIAQTETALVPGELVRLSLAERRKGRGAWVPTAALTEGERGLWSLYAVRDGVVVREAAEIIALGEERVFVRGTIEDGDEIVAATPFRLVPGQRVRAVSRASGSAIAAAGR